MWRADHDGQTVSRGVSCNLPLVSYLGTCDLREGMRTAVFFLCVCVFVCACVRLLLPLPLLLVWRTGCVGWRYVEAWSSRSWGLCGFEAGACVWVGDMLKFLLCARACLGFLNECLLSSTDG